jgi:4-hydroxybenzoate polyprenyltransferase
LPYSAGLLEWLQTQRAAGRRLVLTTAADSRLADAVAAQLGIFEDVVASDGVRNVKGVVKANLLLQRYGRQGFTYIGDHSADLPVWQVATTRGIVNARPATAAAVRRLGNVEIEICDRPHPVAAAIRAMRPYQWVKNLLVFVPVLTAHAIWEAQSWVAAFLAFMAFSACASSVYLTNDLADLAADREHPRKRRRPLANGDLPIPLGLLLTPLLLCIGLAVGALAGIALMVLAYAVLSMSYALRLKEVSLADVFILAALYGIRLAGGGEASGHSLSLWLLAFSGFLFLSLALVKRVKEFTADERAARSSVMRRGYDAADAPILQTFGCAAAFCACVVLSLFVQSEATAERYAQPTVLWGIVPLMLFWLCRVWLWTARGRMHDDPIVFAVRDRISWVIGAAVLIVFLAAGPMPIPAP